MIRYLVGLILALVVWGEEGQFVASETPFCEGFFRRRGAVVLGYSCAGFSWSGMFAAWQGVIFNGHNEGEARRGGL